MKTTYKPLFLTKTWIKEEYTHLNLIWMKHVITRTAWTSRLQTPPSSWPMIRRSGRALGAHNRKGCRNQGQYKRNRNIIWIIIVSQVHHRLIKIHQLRRRPQIYYNPREAAKDRIMKRCCTWISRSSRWRPNTRRPKSTELSAGKAKLLTWYRNRQSQEKMWETWSQAVAHMCLSRAWFRRSSSQIKPRTRRGNLRPIRTSTRRGVWV